MGKSLLITQSNYIPWKGYFDAIALADEVLLYDDMQFTRRDWRNRNRIKTPQGVQWLTIPVEVKGRFNQKINETVVSSPTWGKSHWETLRHNYGRTRHFNTCRPVLEPLFLSPPSKYLSEINLAFIVAVNTLLGIEKEIRSSAEFTLGHGKTERLVELCVALQATEYLTGPAARNYIDESLFAKAGITVAYLDYSGYPEYPQLYGKFVHEVSILDLLFHEGPNAPHFMKWPGKSSRPPHITGSATPSDLNPKIINR
jgi:hypothetical protein